MLQHDIGVHQGEFPPCPIHWHPFVTVGARKDPFRKRRRRHFQPLLRRRVLRPIARAQGPHHQHRRQYPSHASPQAQRASTMRCTSRTHMVWNVCSRSPITEARFMDTAYPAPGVGRKVIHQRLPRKRQYLRLQRRRSRQRKAVRRNQRRPSYRLPWRPLFHQHVFFVAADLHRQRQPQAASRDQVDAPRHVSQVKEFRPARQDGPLGQLHHLARILFAQPVQKICLHHGVPLLSSPASIWSGCAAAPTLGVCRNDSTAACSRRT